VVNQPRASCSRRRSRRCRDPLEAPQSSAPKAAASRTAAQRRTPSLKPVVVGLLGSDPAGRSGGRTASGEDRERARNDPMLFREPLRASRRGCIRARRARVVTTPLSADPISTCMWIISVPPDAHSRAPRSPNAGCRGQSIPYQRESPGRPTHSAAISGLAAAADQAARVARASQLARARWCTGTAHAHGCGHGQR